MLDRIIIEHSYCLTNSNESDSSTNSSDIEEEELDYENLFIGQPPKKGERYLYYIKELKNLTFGTHERNVNEKKRIKEILKWFAKKSVYEDVRLFLLRHNFLSIATYFLTNPQLSLLETIYTLEIIIKLCCIKKVIGDIGKSRNFVKAILSFLQNCQHEKILRKIIGLLRLVMYEIQINSESEWIIRFKECKFFGRRIIFLLESSRFHTGIKLMQLLTSISEINLREQISFLEQLFDVHKLIRALLSYMCGMPKFSGYLFNDFEDVTLIEKMIRLLTVPQTQNGINTTVIDKRLNMVVSNKFLAFPINSQFLTISNDHIVRLCCIVKMLLRFRYVPKIYGGTLDYLNGIMLMILVNLEQAKELQVSEETYLFLQQLKQCLSLYWFHIFTHYTCKHIATILKGLILNNIKQDKVFKYLFNYIILDALQKIKRFESSLIGRQIDVKSIESFSHRFDHDFSLNSSMIPELYEKIKNVIIACNEIHN